MAETIDLVRLAQWMDQQGLAAGPITEVTPLGGGSQNIVIGFCRGVEHYVLRHPPPHKRKNSDETMRREARVLAALAGSDVPHPELIAACGDESILGSAFYLMEAVDGLNPRVELPPKYKADERWRWKLGLAMADGAAAVAAVDYEGRGLRGLGNADGYLERQVERWQSQLDSYARIPGYPGPEIPGVDDVAAWLQSNRPRSWRAGLIHGDYHLANVLCAPDEPRLAAIVDWELTTIGDPLVDLGWLLCTWPDDDPSFETHRIEPWEGFPSRADLVARYAEQSDRDLSVVPWYEVLACFKLGIILEGTRARAFAGEAPKDIGDRLHVRAVGCFLQAAARIKGA